MVRVHALWLAALVLVAAVGLALAPGALRDAPAATSTPHTALATGHARNGAGSASAAGTPDVAISDPAPAGQTGYAETTVAIDPTNPARMVAAAMDFSRDSSLAVPAKIPGVRVWSSADGGLTWADRGLVPFVGRAARPSSCQDAYAADPALTFDRSGNVYLAYLSYGCPEGRVIALVSSSDGGATWSAPSVALVSGDKHFRGYRDSMDREWLAYDPADGGLVMTWSAFLYGPDGYLVGYPIMTARSFDGGRSWGDLALVGADATDRSVGASPQVAPDGTIYVAYPVDKPMQVTEARCPDVQVADYVHPQAQRMMLAVSTDGGRSYQRHVVGSVCPMDHLAADHPFASGGAWFSQAAVAHDPDTGALFVAWTDRALAGPVAVVMRSTDGGATWTRVHEEGGLGTSGLLPQIVAREGRVALLTLRESSVGPYDAALTLSDDGGSTWADPLALNDAALCSCWTQVKSPHRATVQFGHYLGLDAQGGRLAATWMDNRDPLAPQGIHGRVLAWP